MHDEEMTVEFRRLLVMSAGVATTLGTLALVATTGASEVVYSYHRIFVYLPTGAFGLGMLAGSGYGVAGWFLTRLRFTPSMLKAVVVSMVIAYFGTAVIEYVHNAPDSMGFFEYFDRSTQESGFVSADDDGPLTPKPFGAEGYNYRFLELVGLTLGGMGGLFIVPAIRKRLGVADVDS